MQQPTRLDKNTFMDYFLSGIKPIDQNKIGIELECFLYGKSQVLSVNDRTLFTPYKNEEINILLNSLSKFNKSFDDNGYLTGLTSKAGSVSLEPGYQLEYASAPFTNINTIQKNLAEFTQDLKHILNLNNSSLVYLGHQPTLYPDQIPFLNKERYIIMYKYMPQVGELGRNMMKSTATLQVNLDFNSEQDLAKKIRVLACLSPFLIYFSSNSSIVNGKISDCLSYRTKVWEHTDPFRAGMLDLFFDQDFNIEKYVDYLLDVPLYFLFRERRHIKELHNYTFKDLLHNKVPGYSANDKDFDLHANTAFPDIRIKQFLEVRVCDSTSPELALSITALLTGLIYDKNNLDLLFNMTNSWTKYDFLAIKRHLNTHGLTNHDFASINLIDFAESLVDIAKKGLCTRGLHEKALLQPIQKIVESKMSTAQHNNILFRKLNGNVNDFLAHKSV